MATSDDLAHCEALARRGAEGDDTAARELVFEHLWPSWQRLVRASRYLGRFGSDDHVENVRGRLASKILRTLASYPAWRERNPDKTLGDWNRIAVANAVRRYVREQLRDPLLDAVNEVPSPAEMLDEFARAPALEQLGSRPPITAAQTAIELMRFAEAHLTREQHAVLNGWLAGASADDLAAALSLPSAEDATRLQRAAVAILRRAFRGSRALE